MGSQNNLVDMFLKDGDLALRYKTIEKAKHAVHIVHISNALLGAEYALQMKWIDCLAAFAFQSGGHFVSLSKVGVILFCIPK